MKSPAILCVAVSAPFTTTLSARQQEVLAALCRDYIVTGDEVSSAGLVRTHGFRWSSATIRQELAVLERDGFVHRPHRSSGCLPTRAGLERYVRSLPAQVDPSPDLAAAVDRGLRDGGQHLDTSLRAASCVLSEVAGCVAVAFWGSTRSGRIADIEVVPLVGGRALLAMTMDDKSTIMRPVSLPRLRHEGRDLETELVRLRGRLRALCRGRTLSEARLELSRRQQEEEARFDTLLAEALRIGLNLCAGASLDPLWLQVSGQPTLARGLPHLDHITDVLELLEDVHRLADVLCQLLPEGDEGSESVRASVRMGLEASVSTEESLGGIALVGCRVRGQGPRNEARTGAVAVLGSARMDYAALIPLVEYAARTLATHTGA